MLEVACAAYHIPKNELGMTDKVNKASSQEQEDVAFRHAVAPDAKWLKEVLFDPIIADDFGRPDLQFDWDFGKAEDQAANAATEQQDVKLGIISANESRRRRYGDLDGDAPGPPAGAAVPGVTKRWNGIGVETIAGTVVPSRMQADRFTGSVLRAAMQAEEAAILKGAAHTGAMVALMLPRKVARSLSSSRTMRLKGP
jgi:hypothetical protein